MASIIVRSPSRTLVANRRFLVHQGRTTSLYYVPGIYTVVITSPIVLSSSAIAKYGEKLIDGLNIGTYSTTIYGWSITSGFSLVVVQSQKIAHGVLLIETVKLNLLVAALSKYKLGISEKLFLALVQSLARKYVVTDQLSMTSVLKAAFGLTILSRLAIRDVPSALAHYGAVVLDKAGFSAHVEWFLYGLLGDSLGLHDALTKVYAPLVSVQETALLQALLGGSLLFRFELDDSLDLTDQQLLRAIYRGDPLIDGINLWAAYVDPGGGFMTWAINTRTNAVTEYKNYVFNSISKMGHKFLGATTEGLWELDGELDDATSIATRIKTGWIQVSGSKFTSFKAAYLGLRVKDNGTDFFLKLHSGDGRTYIYQVSPRDMQTTKVHMGKGLRARYFSFELVTSGADFDLDTVEFVPISSNRRV